MTKPYCLVVGDPIAHSLSPVIHLSSYRKLGLDWDFLRRRIPSGQLGSLLAELRTETDFSIGGACRGLAVTMPLKPEALQQAAFVDGLAKATGAVNTLVMSCGDWAGFNTDVAGIVQAFRHRGVDLADFENLHAVVFGSGATAGSAIAALRELGAGDITVVSRSGERLGAAFKAADRMFVEVSGLCWSDQIGLTQTLKHANLVFSTVPGSYQRNLPLPALNPEAYVLDAVYDPWPTPIVAWAMENQAKVIPGWEMLAHQGVAQVKLFTGMEVSAASVISALEKAIQDR